MICHLPALHPVSFSHMQLHKLAYKIVNSSTILLPAWKSMLQDLGLHKWLMPCDVATRWNSTFDMLDFAIEYHAGVVAMVEAQGNNLQMLELSDEEWKIAMDLHATLKVYSILC